MAEEYLEDSYTFDVNMLVEPIRQNTLLRKLMTPEYILDPSDLEIEIETTEDDLVLHSALDPTVSSRSTAMLSRARYTVPELDMGMWYGHDELKRLDNSKLPYNQRVALMGAKFAQVEDAMFFAEVLTGVVGDVKSIGVAANHTDATTQLNVSSYQLGVSSLASQIGQLVSTYGDIKGMELVLVVTPDVYNIAMGKLNTNGDLFLLETMDQMLKRAGAPTSRIEIGRQLGCTVTRAADGKITITTNVSGNAEIKHDNSVSGELTAVLLANDRRFFTVYASPFDPRQRDTNKVDGAFIKVVERWLPYVHKKEAIIYSDTAVIA